MNTTLSIILFALFVALVSYFIGLRRGISESEHLYDDGWLDAEEYFKRFPELVQETEPDKYEKAKELVHQLDELFDGTDDEDYTDDDSQNNNIIDCGTY